MKYQEVYRGLNKRTSNEQLVKLASIIGMRKRAADAKADKAVAVKKAAPGTTNNPGAAQAIADWKDVMNPNESRFKSGDIDHQYIKNNFSPDAYHAFLRGELHKPGKDDKTGLYDSYSALIRQHANPWPRTSEVGKEVGDIMDSIHDWKVDYHRRTGILPTSEMLDNPKIREDLDDFQQKRVKSPTHDSKEGWQLFEDHIRSYLNDPRVKEAVNPERLKKWKERPERAIFDLSKNTRKPSYSQQLYS